MLIEFLWVDYLLLVSLTAGVVGNIWFLIEGKKGRYAWTGGPLAIVACQAYLATQHLKEPEYLLGEATVALLVFGALNAGVRLVRYGMRFAGRVEATPQVKTNDQDLDRDLDYIEAKRTVARLEAILNGAEWSDAKRLVNEILDQRLPELLRLRRELQADEKDLAERKQHAYVIAQLPEDPNRSSRSAILIGNNTGAAERHLALTVSHHRTAALIVQATERIDATKDALDQLLIIARERQLNGTPEAVENADRLLAETRAANENMLRVSRELSALGARTS